MKYGQPRALKLNFPARKEAVPRVRHRVSQFLIDEGCVRRAVDELVLALDELCNNAIEHGAVGNGGGCSEAKLALTIRIDVKRQETVGILLAPGVIEARDLEQITTASCLPDLDSERGRGLFLFRAMVDEFEVSTVGEGMLEMRFKKLW